MKKNYTEAQDSKTSLRLVLSGQFVEFAGTPDGVFDGKTGRRVGTSLVDFKQSLGIQTEMVPYKDVARAFGWFKRQFPDLVPDTLVKGERTSVKKKFSPSLFIKEHALQAPDSFGVSSAEEAQAEKNKVVNALPLAREQGAEDRILRMFEGWIRGWTAVFRRYNQEGTDRTAVPVGPSPQAMAKKNAKREKNRQERMKMRGKSGGGGGGKGKK